jgi:hypothetical protein
MHRSRRWVVVPLAAIAATVFAVSGGSVPAGAGTVQTCAGPSGPSSPQEQLETYVCNLYVRLLLRTQRPSDAEVAFWVNQIQTTSRARVVNAFERSDENFDLLVTQDYLDFLGRAPDAGGKQHWIDVLRQNVPIELVDAAILASAEGFAEQGGTNDDFVDALYDLFLDRVPNDQEVAFWVGQITSHGNDVRARAGVVIQIELSAEGRGRTVDSLYSYWLNRSADGGGRAFWADRLSRLGIILLEADFVAQDEAFGAQSH